MVDIRKFHSDKLQFDSFQFSSVIQLIRLRLRQTSIPLFLSLVSANLRGLLSLGVFLWLLQSAIAPMVAQAYTSKVSLSINHHNGESYQTLLHRAEAIARAAAQRSFDRDILVTDVDVIVLGQNNGTITPLLALEVTRQAWRSFPDPQRWIRYYPTAQSLLQLEDSTSTPSANQPGVPIPLQPGIPNTGVPGTVPSNGAGSSVPLRRRLPIP